MRYVNMRQTLLFEICILCARLLDNEIDSIAKLQIIQPDSGITI